TMGPWGWMHSRTNTWFVRESSWLEYVNRCQHLLRQGLPVADLVYFAGVEVPVDTPVWPDQLNPTPPLGYYYDVTDGEGILSRMKAENGGITLPDGLSYRVLVLPEDRMLTLDLLRKVRDLVQGGAVVVGPKPEKAPGLGGYPGSDSELSRLADEVWRDLDGKTSTERSFGKGKVFWGQPMKAVLDKLNIKPDFDFTSRSGDAPINYIHRHMDGTDIYFVANRRRQSEELVCTFRVENKQPEIWNPETGEIAPAEVYDLVDGGVRLPLRLGPSGSIFVVFRSPAEGNRLQAISREGTTLAGTRPFPALTPGRYRDVTNNFTISVWVKPEIDLGLPPKGAPAGISSFFSTKSYVIYPPAGNAVYGQKHAACGLTAGRDGVIVFERSDGRPSQVIVARMPLSGWTFLTVVYNAGVPSLYVDGKLVEQGKKSANVVHPGLGEAFERDGAGYFHGEMSEPKLFKEALSQGRIAQMAKAGVPRLEEPPAIELVGNGKPELLIWQNGSYALHRHSGGASSIEISGIGDPQEIRGPWRVSFPPNLGAPAEITLPKLISLHKHAEEGVRYFSGTATYTKSFHVASNTTAGGKRLYLDLGRVEVFAEVRLNGKNLGVLWRPPRRVDVTQAIRPGENNLEVLVTNLWPNRLIGDEHLPPENQYDESGGMFGGAIKKLPAWYVEGKPKPPGGRITFATWKHFDKDSPLLESGLVGPVLLRTAARRPISS
ncbi:MAG: glycosyl hydrolase, partial [Acidobacteriota bacterium]